MRSLKPSASFFIFFTAILIVPCSAGAAYLQTLLQNHSTDGFLKQMADWGVIQAPTAIALVGICFWIYNTYLWKKWPFSLIHGIPDIGGRYKGELESIYENKKYPIVVEVKQKLLSVHVCLYTERSSSYSLISDIGENGCENKFLAYAYINTPTTVSDDLDMRTHGGFACLEIFDAEERLDGYYYNNPRDRGRYGKMTCKFEGPEIKGHF